MMEQLVSIAIVGCGATLAMDAWGVVRKPLFGFARPDYALIGRWFGHMPRGRFRHDAIAAAHPIAGERVLGWVAHYVIGLSFAALLLAWQGAEWIDHPTLSPALAVGVVTVGAPLFLMQPGMGLGVAGSRTPRPAMVRLQALITHTVFGIGLYAAGWIAHLVLVN